jgi:hypothetical protein
MAHFPFKDAKILLDKYDLSGDMNAVGIARTQKELDNKTFVNSGFEMRIPGFQDGIVSMAGLLETAAGGQDEILHGRFGLTDIPVFITLKQAVDFERAWFGQFMQGNYNRGGTVGERAEWTAEGKLSANALVAGNIMAVGTKTGTFNGVARQLGQVSATQRLYAAIHATAKNAFTSAVFKVQSDDNGGFSSPTDRITFTTITDLVAEFAAPVLGPITDDYWRVICSAFTGTSLDIYAAVGIQ